jgi:hypothetical protein
LKLAGQLEDIAHQIDHGVLDYEQPDTVAYVRHALLLAASHLIEVLENTSADEG